MNGSSGEVMTKKQFSSFVRKTLKTATTSKDEVQRLIAVQMLAVIALTAEHARAT
jgi:hypothetical protein